MNSVALSYAGVHQIFQLALAAHEMGELNSLFCSIVDGPGKWGRMLRKWAPKGTILPLGSDAIPPDRMIEFPWPMLMNRTAKKLLPKRQTNHLRSNTWFDHAAARWLRGRTARVFVGGESCALASLKMAGEMGMRRVLDCPGIPAEVLDAEARIAAAKFDVKVIANENSSAMGERKKLELAEADLVLCCSSHQRDHLVKLNPEVKRTEVIPLWTDVDFWSALHGSRRFTPAGKPLRVLYAGAVSLRKGVPYLLEAVEPLANEVSLTLVGGISDEMSPLLKRYRSHRHLPYLEKQELRSLYSQHDVLVMPTLGDSFGFVTVEAMASGMPVITSQNAGAPVPDQSWRVPAHDAESIRNRLLAYHADRDMLEQDAEMAAEFGARFRPEQYRACVQSLFKELLAS